MTQCHSQLSLGFLGSKEITAAFDGGNVSSDGGLMLVAEADAALGLTAKLAQCLPDHRDPAKVRHELREMLSQRVYQIACGYEDCNDADDLRFDPIFKTAVGRLPQSDPSLASQPTLSRFENRVTRTQLLAMAQVLVDLFVHQHSEAVPHKIVLDFDATDDPTHGQQQLAGFHGYYDEHCYLPLLVTAQVDDGPDELLVAMLRPGRSHAGAHARGVLKRLVATLRDRWPQVQIILRADNGFAKPEIYDWCEANGVDYLLSLAKNSRLLDLASRYLSAARIVHRLTGDKARLIFADAYAADGWPRQRRVLIKAEVSTKGDNPRFVVTSLPGDPQELYDQYAKRGDPENRIKELKCDLKIDRTSCHRFVANQFRLILHAAAFVLLSSLRKQLAGTELAKAQVCTLQRHLLKLGVRVTETARRVWLHLASNCPVRDLWPVLVARMRASPA
jgi:hypothetical protein